MRILFLTLYYPPLNTIAAYRAGAFEKYLTKEGHVVDVITRYYDEEQQKGNSMLLGAEDSKNFNKNYVRSNNVVYTNFIKNNSKLSFSKKLPPIIRGLYNYNVIDVFHFGWIPYMLDAYEKEFSKNKYDFIISSFGPPIMMLAANMLSKKSGTPFLIDFRDAYINEEDKGIHYFLKKRNQQKLLKHSAGLTFSTEGMKNYYLKRAGAEFMNKPTCIVYNGVEDGPTIEKDSLLDRMSIKQFDDFKNKHSLLLVHTGTLYQGQNIQFFIDAVERYNLKHKKNAAIVFLGLAQNKIDKIPSKTFIFYLNKVNLQTSLYIQKNASALLLPIWDGRYTGFSGKTLEYIYSGNFVITSPKPQPDLKDFFDISSNIFVANDVDAFGDIIQCIDTEKCLRKPLINSEKLFRSYWIKDLSNFLSKLK
jgi:hypothetical protein